VTVVVTYGEPQTADPATDDRDITRTGHSARSLSPRASPSKRACATVTVASQTGALAGHRPMVPVDEGVRLCSKRWQTGKPNNSLQLIL